MDKANGQGGRHISFMPIRWLRSITDQPARQQYLTRNFFTLRRFSP